MRVRLALILTGLTLSLSVLPPAANAAFAGGTTSGDGSCGAACGTGNGGGDGGGGGSGNNAVTVWMPPADSYSHWGRLPWLGNQGAYGVPYTEGSSPTNATYENYDQQMTQALLGYPNHLTDGQGNPGPDQSGGGRCDIADWTDATECPLWYTQRVDEPFDQPLPGAASWAYNDHSGDPLHLLVHPVNFAGAHALVVMWNVLIWRYDDETAGTRAASATPIFARTVDLFGQTTAGYGTTSTDASGVYDAYWYYAGTTNIAGSVERR